MNHKGSYSAYIGVIALIALSVMAYTTLSAMESGNALSTIRGTGQVREQWTIARIALDKAFSDSLADKAYSEITSPNCPGAQLATYNYADLSPYFSAFLTRLSLNSGINCEISGTPSVAKAGLNFDLTNASLKCSLKIKGKSDTEFTSKIEYTFPMSLKKNVLFTQMTGGAPAVNTGCNVKVTDRDSGIIEVDYTK